MVAVLTVAVAVVGPLTVLNLAVCLAIVRRLRAYDAGWTPTTVNADVPATGTLVAPFAATTVDGHPVTDRDLAGADTFVGVVVAAGVRAAPLLRGFAVAAAGRPRPRMHAGRQ